MLTVLKRAGYILAALWIFSGAAIYYWRFTDLFLQDHGDAIADLREKVASWFAALL
jgi:hypothetical protein